MATIELGTAPAVPRRSFRDAVDWARIVVATAARGLVVTLLGLALWAAAPAIIGWHPTTVMTGSMEPRLAPGDVVVSRPVDPAQLRLGQVVLYDDPDQPGELRLHRIHAVRAGNMLIMKGDANPQPDSTPISRSVVHGVAFIRVPYVGLPILWLRDGEWHRLVLLVLALTVIAWLGTIDESLRRLAAPTSMGSDDSDPADSAGPRAADVAPSGADGRGDVVEQVDGRSGAGVRSWSRAAVGVVVFAVGLSGAAFVPSRAEAAAFGAITSNAVSSWKATTVVSPTQLTCTTNTNKSVTVGWSYTGSDTPASFDVMNGSSSVTNVAASARSATLTGTGSGTYTLTVRTNLTTTWTAASASSVTITVTNSVARCS
jgi:signal peptidase I